MSLPDYYAILNVSSSATLDQIRQSYRKLARLYHPDINKHVEDSYIKQLNEAYDILSDLTRRNAYDLQRLETIRRELLLNMLIKQRNQSWRKEKMTWTQGMKGFVTELKKEMHGD